MADARRRLREIDDYCTNVGGGQEALPEYFRLLRPYVDSDHAGFFHADSAGRIVGGFHEVPQHMPQAAEFIRRARSGTDVAQNDLLPSVAELFQQRVPLQNLSFESLAAKESALYRDVIRPVGGLNVLRVGIRRSGRPAGIIALVRGRRSFHDRDVERLRKAAKPLARLIGGNQEGDNERMLAGEGFFLLPREDDALDGDAEGLRLWSLLFDPRFLPARDPKAVLASVREGIRRGQWRTSLDHGLGQFELIAVPFEGTARVLLRIQRHLSTRVVFLHRMSELALSSMQKAVCLGILHGRTQPEMAEDHGIGLQTVVTHVRALYAKAGVAGRAELIALFRASGDAPSERGDFG